MACPGFGCCPPQPSAILEKRYNSSCVLLLRPHPHPPHLSFTLFRMNFARPGGRDAFGEVLRSRSREHLFVEVVLIRDVNDSPRLARALASLLRPLPTRASINLLPYNDTGHPLFRAATPVAVREFQRILNDEGFVATIRTARCDRHTSSVGGV